MLTPDEIHPRANQMESSVDDPLEQTATAVRAPIAPWWHCALLIAIIIAASVFGSMHSAKSTMASHHFGNYAFTFVWEWALAGFAYWGIRLRKTPVRQLLGERRRGFSELLNDVAAAGIFWILCLLVLAILATGLKLIHFESAQKQIAQLAPANAAEAVLWIALSVSAAICEEFLFRGYLQQQFARATGRTWVGVAVSALLFGTAHGYEGVAGMLMITVYGALFSLLAIKRRSLRAGMIAHAWHDSFSGLVLWALKRANVPLGIV